MLSIEGGETGEWVLVDLGDIVVHIMQPAIRDYYRLEDIWGESPIELEDVTGPFRKKAAAKKPAPKKPGAKKAPSKTAPTKKPPSKTSAAKTAESKKPATKKSAAKKPATKKKS